MEILLAASLALLSATIITALFLGIGLVKQHFNTIMLNQVLLGSRRRMGEMLSANYSSRRRWRRAGVVVFTIAFLVTLFLIWPF